MEFLRKCTRQQATTFSEIQPNDRVLDVCTGTVELALAFTRAGATVAGIDIAEDMLSRFDCQTGLGHQPGHPPHHGVQTSITPYVQAFYPT